MSGGIAAYKAALLLRLLTESGWQVTVVPTDAALRFVGAATWEALSGRPVHTAVWDDTAGVEHVSLGRAADLVIVAPATADLLARAATGRADDLLTTTLLTVTCPVVMAPAMHTEMWLNQATQANVALLRSRGIVVLDPAEGRLTGADSGPGRLPEPEALAEAARAVLRTGGRRDLAGRRVVISAGGTREPLDPVRFLGNRSSGRQGYALAAAAAARGAQVTLVSANVELAEPAGVRVLRVGSARELAAEVNDAAPGADIVVMAAAVADFRPAQVAADKIKKDQTADGTPPPVALVRNPDVLAGLDRGAGRRPAARQPRPGRASRPRPGTPTVTRWPTRGPSSRARGSTSSCSTTSPAGRCSASAATRSTCWTPVVGWQAPTPAPSPTWRMSSGTGSPDLSHRRPRLPPTNPAPSARAQELL